MPPTREPDLLTHQAGEDAPAQDRAAKDRIDALVASTGATGGAAGGAAGGATHASEQAEYAHASAGHAAGAGGNGRKNGKRGRGRGRFLRRGIYTFITLFIVLPMVAFGITYLIVDVPSPHEVAEQQGGTVPYFYSDGSEMGRDTEGGDRVILNPSDIPEDVRHAIYAAEDSTFETNRGFDLSAIARAGWSQLTGGTGGGSTISQQYVKVATDTDDQTLQRKATEVVRAFKMNNQQSKSEIITSYLNTIYLGRGAYGIEAAAQAYFDKQTDELTKPESAYLAGIIQAPSRSDDPDYTERRWDYVMDQMVENGWMSASERAEAEFPQPVDPEQTQPTTMSGPKHYIKERVNEELEELGYSDSQIRAQGYQVHTTIEERAQDLAVETVEDVMGGQPENLNEALVAVDPNTGGIRAYYGGEVSEDNQRDWANTPRNPGSTMKPFDFVALLQDGKGAGETYDGTSPRTFGEGSEPVTVHNVNEEQCSDCTVTEAMQRSINTVFYDMVVNDTGTAAVAEAAESAGVSERSTLESDNANIAIGGGATAITPRDMAVSFGTFAADGIQRDSHLVSQITTAEGEIVYQADPEGESAFATSEEESEQIAGNVTEALEDVLPHSDLTCAGGRSCAGKTGTHQSHEDNENSQAWMTGYTPSLATSVWVGDEGSDPIRNASGAKVFGSGLPGQIWKQFTDAYLEGQPDEPFTDVEGIGEPEPTPEPVDPSPAPDTGGQDDAPPQREDEGDQPDFEPPENLDEEDGDSPGEGPGERPGEDPGEGDGDGPGGGDDDGPGDGDDDEGPGNGDDDPGDGNGDDEDEGVL